jgi:hypothetical protein
VFLCNAMIRFASIYDYIDSESNGKNRVRVCVKKTRYKTMSENPICVSLGSLVSLAQTSFDFPVDT